MSPPDTRALSLLRRRHCVTARSSAPSDPRCPAMAPPWPRHGPAMAPPWPRHAARTLTAPCVTSACACSDAAPPGAPLLPGPRGRGAQDAAGGGHAGTALHGSQHTALQAATPCSLPAHVLPPALLPDPPCPPTHLIHPARHTPYHAHTLHTRTTPHTPTPCLCASRSAV